VTVPLVATDHAMSQLMLDIKMSQLAAWTTSNVIYDDSVGKLGASGMMNGKKPRKLYVLILKTTKPNFGVGYKFSCY